MKRPNLFAIAASAAAVLAAAASADVTVNMGNALLGAGEYITAPVVAGFTGTLTSFTITYEFIDNGIDSYASDAGLVINGEEWGTYDIDLATTTNWNDFWAFDGVLGSGTYTDTRTDIPATIIGVGSYTLDFGNAYFYAAPVQYNNIVVVLHGIDASASPPPFMSGAAATPSAGVAGTPVTVSVNVTPGSNPDDSAGLVVTANLTALGGSAAAALVHGAGNSWSVNTSIPAGANDFSAYTVTISCHDSDVPQRSAFPVNVIVRGVSTVWDETANGGGDAGNLPATALVPTGSSLGAITGNLDVNDVDMFKISVCDAANFEATTRLGAGAPDTQMFLFKAAGDGAAMDDDNPAGVTPATANGNFSSTLNNVPGLANGVYYLAVAMYDTDPLNAAGQQIWADSTAAGDFDTVRAPDGAGVTDFTVASWNTGSLTTVPYTYRVSLKGACIAGPAVCSVADVGITGGAPGHDNRLDNNDFIVFINLFFAQAPAADLGVTGGTPGHDGLWDNNDFIVFINIFFNDTPNCTG